MWTQDEDDKLKDVVQMHDGEDGQDWAAIAWLVPGRTKRQCMSRWLEISALIDDMIY
jgi:hypothetical protein